MSNKKIRPILSTVGLVLLTIGVMTALPPETRSQPASASQGSDKDPTPPDPNRPYYDVWGNQFTYDGQLISVGRCPYTDPTSGQPNPYCPAAPDNSTGGK